jgi:hypothetical protein
MFVRTLDRGGVAMTKAAGSARRQRHTSSGERRRSGDDHVDELERTSMEGQRPSQQVPAETHEVAQGLIKLQSAVGYTTRRHDETPIARVTR